jgi:hypothetical protein
MLILGIFLCLPMACQGAPESSTTQTLSRVEENLPSANQVRIFSDAASHIVGAFEALKKLDSRYDETGFCGSGCSIWQFTTKNPSVRYHLRRFENIVAPGVNGPDAGRYTGYVEFTTITAPQKLIRIDIDLLYSGEDYTVDIKPII